MNQTDKRKQFRRLLVLVLVAVICGLISAANLISLELIHGDEYAEQADRQYSYTRTISASRGEILDCNGVTLVGNSTMYAIVIDYATWPSEGRNEVVLKLADLIDADETAQMKDSLPIHLRNKEFVYTSKKSENYQKLQSFCEERGWGSDLTAEEVIEQLCDYYDISDSYSNLKKIRIIRVRYQMTREQFSIYNPFTIATNASIDLVVKVMEQHDTLPGVEVETQSERRIDTDTAGNIIGYTGPIYEEDWEEYESLGYSMDSIVGKVGIEQALESYLHGKDGERTIQTDSKGNVLREETEREAESGYSTVLTIDSEFQKVVEDALAERCQAIDGAEGGAAVVLDVNTGEILAMANYPTYNPQTFQEDFETLNANSLSPLVNRSIATVYAPGSTFKLCTALAGLEEGVIGRYTQIYDEGIYTYYDNYQPKCWIYNAYGTTHGSEDVVDAIKDSCNYFFFETGRLLGGEKLEQYAKKFGLGEYTGIELSGEKTGTVSGPTERAEAVKNGTAVEWSGRQCLYAAAAGKLLCGIGKRRNGLFGASAQGSQVL
jgi:penicillin-binding protein 2